MIGSAMKVFFENQTAPLKNSAMTPVKEKSHHSGLLGASRGRTRPWPRDRQTDQSARTNDDETKAGASLSYDQTRRKERNINTMKTFAFALLACCVAFVSASAATEQEIVDQSVEILQKFRQIPERGIPPRILSNARGVAIIRVVKAGFVFSGKGGEGVVVARTAHGWSGPSFIGLGGAGWGLQIGAEISDFIFVLNNDAAVRAFSRDGNVKIGADVSAAAGPVGRDLQAGVTPTAAVYTYSRSKGLFAGVSLEGAILGTQKTANDRYYGRVVGARSILGGRVSPPAGARRLLNALNRY
jgi:SH3 domain-containing YSC84-like protein 1